MKFTEGYWEKNERANALYAVQAGYAEKIAAGMRVIATFKPILGRADELDVGTMVMEFTAAGKDRIQVTYTHFLGYENRVAMTNRAKHDPDPESNEILYNFFEWYLCPTS